MSLTILAGFFSFALGISWLADRQRAKLETEPVCKFTNVTLGFDGESGKRVMKQDYINCENFVATNL